ncbi:MAG TPA: PAS domain-containing protein [Stellaceae bacterium]|jgi:PAS domain S-box-containing protein|nr:PAS domain-containing protein [Stellaceae bacterium]
MADDLLPDNFPKLLVEGCPDAIIYASAEGVIRYWNRAATRIFGFSAGEAVGQRLDLIIPERLRGRHWEGWDRVMAGNPSRYDDGALLAVPAARKDGSPLSIEFTILPVRDAAGKLTGIAAFLRDGTQRFEEMRALRRELAAFKA